VMFRQGRAHDAATARIASAKVIAVYARTTVVWMYGYISLKYLINILWKEQLAYGSRWCVFFSI
jgi:hypothetical protein